MCGKRCPEEFAFHFNLISISGAIQYTPFPYPGPSLSAPTQVSLPDGYTHTGPVCSMEWSSDGYVLAVGWQEGWGIFSVGGRCLARGLGVEDVHVDRYGAVHI